MFTDPVLEGANIPTLVEDDVKDDHDQQGDVEGRNGCCGVEVSTKCDQHPG